MQSDARPNWIRPLQPCRRLPPRVGLGARARRGAVQVSTVRRTRSHTRVHLVADRLTPLVPPLTGTGCPWAPFGRQCAPSTRRLAFPADGPCWRPHQRSSWRAALVHVCSMCCCVASCVCACIGILCVQVCVGVGACAAVRVRKWGKWFRPCALAAACVLCDVSGCA